MSVPNGFSFSTSRWKTTKLRLTWSTVVTGDDDDDDADDDDDGSSCMQATFKE